VLARFYFVAAWLRRFVALPRKSAITNRSQLKVKRTQRVNAPLPNEADGISRKQLSQLELAQNARNKTNPIRSRPAPPSPSLSRRAGIDSWLPNKRCISKRTHREIHKSRWTKELRKMSTERKAKQSHPKPTLPSAPPAYGLQPLSLPPSGFGVSPFCVSSPSCLRASVPSCLQFRRFSFPRFCVSAGATQ